MRDGRVVKGVQFHGLRDAGDPVEQVGDDAIGGFIIMLSNNIPCLPYVTICFHKHSIIIIKYNKVQYNHTIPHTGT